MESKDILVYRDEVQGYPDEENDTFVSEEMLSFRLDFSLKKQRKNNRNQGVIFRSRF